MAKLFRKKPVIISAQRFQPHDDETIFQFQSADGFTVRIFPIYTKPDSDNRRVLIIETLEGNVTAEIGDWIIQGINGELYPCKPDIFEKTYEEIISA